MINNKVKSNPHLRRGFLYGWLFHYNNFRGKWEAVHRENYTELFNGGPNVIRHKSRQVIEEAIINGSGKSKRAMYLVG